MLHALLLRKKKESSQFKLSFLMGQRELIGHIINHIEWGEELSLINLYRCKGI